jgi:hypothetical protein
MVFVKPISISHIYIVIPGGLLIYFGVRVQHPHQEKKLFTSTAVNTYVYNTLIIFKIRPTF